MRPRRAASEEVAETARRRLELLTAELALLRDQQEDPAGDVPVTSAPATTVPVTSAPSYPRDSPPNTAGAAAPGRHARRPVGVRDRVGGWLQDRLPATLQGRVGLSHGNLAVVALLVASGLAVTAWWVVRAEGVGEVVPPATWTDRAEGAPVPALSPVAEPTGPTDPTDPTGETGETGEIVVDVTGKVRRRGIVALPSGSRVVDAVEAAGGTRRGVDLAPLNLARVLVDGEQIVVGVPLPPGVAAGAASAAGETATGTPLVNINVATQSELEGLPGVGPVTAEAIISWRTENGAFRSVDELLEVSGIGDARLADIAPHVTL